jgi:CspA family cold shock protein
MNGKVKWFNARRGYGFITGTDGKDYFVHYSAIESEGYKSLNENDQVTFEVKHDEKGDAAINVKLVAAAA